MSEVADGPEMKVIGRAGIAAAASQQPGDGLGDEADDLVVADDAEVVVGQERDRPAALARAAVEDDRPGLGDPQRAGRQHAVAALELVVGQARLAEELDARRAPSRRAGRRARPAASPLAPAQAAAIAPGRSRGSTVRTVALYSAHALDEVLDQLGAVTRSVRCDKTGRSATSSAAPPRHVAERLADLREDRLARVAHVDRSFRGRPRVAVGTLARSLHHSRNVCCATG